MDCIFDLLDNSKWLVCSGGPVGVSRSITLGGSASLSAICPGSARMGAADRILVSVPCLYPETVVPGKTVRVAARRRQVTA
jgi:hypothetical protein